MHDGQCFTANPTHPKEYPGSGSKIALRIPSNDFSAGYTIKATASTKQATEIHSQVTFRLAILAIATASDLTVLDTIGKGATVAQAGMAVLSGMHSIWFFVYSFGLTTLDNSRAEVAAANFVNVDAFPAGFGAP
jgi:hypothetical protein